MMPEAFKFPDEIDEDKKPAENNDEFEIELVDDTPARDQGRKPLDKEVSDPTEDEIENYSENVKKRIKELTHARHDERRKAEQLSREREELARVAQQLINENKQLKHFVNNGSKEYATTLKSSAEQSLEMARRNLKAAQEAFDTDAIIAAQEALTDAKMRLAAANNFRPTSLQVDQTPVQPRPQAPQQVQPDEKTLRWQAKNQWFGSQGFEEVTSFALGLHQKLVNSGVNPQSDEYFNAIDTRVKNTFPDLFGETQTRNNAESAPRKTASVVAPATRSTGKKSIQLTTTQQGIAKRLGLTNQQYAKEVLKLEN
jgi:hypothetical protein